RDAQPYPVHGISVICKSGSPQDKFLRGREFLGRIEDSPERWEALKLLTDHLGLPAELQAGLAPTRRSAIRAVSPQQLERGDRLERHTLAGVLRHRGLVS